MGAIISQDMIYCRTKCQQEHAPTFFCQTCYKYNFRNSGSRPGERYHLRLSKGYFIAIVKGQFTFCNDHILCNGVIFLLFHRISKHDEGLIYDLFIFLTLPHRRWPSKRCRNVREAMKTMEGGGKD